MNFSSGNESDSLTGLSEISPDDTVGAAFIGYSFACVVLGVLTSQVSNYYQKYVADPKPVRILVLIAAISGIIAKICFVLRIWKFSRRNIFITATISMIIVAQFGLIIAFVVAAYKLQSLFYLSKLRMIGSAALATGALGDVLTAVASSFYLRRLRTGFTESDCLVNHLTRYAINTGALTSTMSLLTLILYDARPNTFQFMGVYFVLSKTFAVSLMCTLNARKEIAGRALEEEEISHDSGSAIIPVTSNDTSTVSTAFRMESDYIRSGNHIQPYLIRENIASPSKMDVKLSVTTRNRRTSSSASSASWQVRNTDSQMTWTASEGINLSKLRKA
ncbi:hypothetical protein DFH05DRAFT_424729 [Lentinula detonsa]|uniref:DUF6534 domain-containing protein n=1 Tax=Lentinula detonsa TaxID=2804962 RepID=A0A9W8TTV1_9AGAR|nr:hypothetical protein DFH05DRAFT_424729 [Lentinula detonsa]